MSILSGFIDATSNVRIAASRRLFPYDESRARTILMKIKPIRTNSDYERALREIEHLWDANEGTPEDERLDTLVALVDAYESEHFPIDAPDPIEAIRFRLEQQARRGN
jgi:antitoxin component HigA of HigAB toxin-antitoxin module